MMNLVSGYFFLLSFNSVYLLVDLFFRCFLLVDIEVSIILRMAMIEQHAANAGQE